MLRPDAKTAEYRTLPDGSRMRLLRPGGWVKSDLYMLEKGDGRFLVKDLSSRSNPLRPFLTSWFLRKEVFALRALEGLEGVPRLHCVWKGPALVLEWLDARRLSALDRAEVKPEFFSEVRRLLDEVHARGVAHGDMHRTNILVGPGFEPCLVDFQTSFIRSPGGPGMVQEVFWDHLAANDLIALLRIRAEYFPDLPLTPGESRLMAGEPAVSKTLRFLRRRVYRGLKRVLRGQGGKNRRTRMKPPGS